MKTRVLLAGLCVLTVLFASCGDSGGGGGAPGTAPSAASGASASSPLPPAGGTVAMPLQRGVWGGARSTLVVNDTNAQYRYQCNTGQVPMTITADANGFFDVDGSVTEAHGGPQRPGDTHPARFTGTVSGSVLDLTVNFINSQGNSVSYVDRLELGFEGPAPGICPL
ncbi:MAG: hypothetical protein HY075_01145 [Deltaproteobacteria bacterium]|nr:hypothetical protein [Deltaproteobacteria bacterium]